MPKGSALFVSILLVSRPYWAETSLLMGCREPDVTIALVAQIRAHWDDIPMRRFESLWPTELNIMGTSKAGEAVYLGWDGRIISNKCECGERFIFADPDDDPEQHIRKVTTIFSSKARNDLLVVGKRLVAAWRTPENDMVLDEAAWTFEPDGSLNREYSWVLSERGEAAVTLDIEIITRGDVSTLIVEYSLVNFARIGR